MALGSSKKAKAAVPANPAPMMQPLFFKRPRMLDAAVHAQAAVVPTSSYAFAKATNSVPVNAIEFIEIGKYYPIVFTDQTAPAPLALVGLEQSNYFVNEEGQWRPNTYIPAYVRQYPFIFFENSEKEQFILCIDEEAPQFREKSVEGSSPLFTDGKPSELTNHALKFCTDFYRHHNITTNFCADLVKHKLLTSFSSTATLASGKKFQLGGFQMIDEKAFNALPDKVFAEFRKKGWLAFIYLAMASASNWSKLTEMAE